MENIQCKLLELYYVSPMTTEKLEIENHKSLDLSKSDQFYKMLVIQCYLQWSLCIYKLIFLPMNQDERYA